MIVPFKDITNKKLNKEVKKNPKKQKTQKNQQLNNSFMSYKKIKLDYIKVPKEIKEFNKNKNKYKSNYLKNLEIEKTESLNKIENIVKNTIKNYDSLKLKIINIFDSHVKEYKNLEFLFEKYYSELNNNQFFKENNNSKIFLKKINIIDNFNLETIYNDNFNKKINSLNYSNYENISKLKFIKNLIDKKSIHLPNFANSESSKIIINDFLKNINHFINKEINDLNELIYNPKINKFDAFSFIPNFEINNNLIINQSKYNFLIEKGDVYSNLFLNFKKSKNNISSLLFLKKEFIIDNFKKIETEKNILDIFDIDENVKLIQYSNFEIEIFNTKNEILKKFNLIFKKQITSCKQIDSDNILLIFENKIIKKINLKNNNVNIIYNENKILDLFILNEKSVLLVFENNTKLYKLKNNNLFLIKEYKKLDKVIQNNFNTYGIINNKIIKINYIHNKIFFENLFINEKQILELKVVENINNNKKNNFLIFKEENKLIIFDLAKKVKYEIKNEIIDSFDLNIIENQILKVKVFINKDIEEFNIVFN